MESSNGLSTGCGVEWGYYISILKANAYPRSRGLLRFRETYSSFGVFLDLSGTQWEKHPNSPGTFFPTESAFYCNRLPRTFCEKFGEYGRLYSNYFSYFSRISQAPFKKQAGLIEDLIVLDRLGKIKPDWYIV